MRPDQVETPIQLIVNTDLRITWTAPNQRGSPITVYNIYVKNSVGVNVEYVNCRSTSVICSIAMADLIS